MIRICLILIYSLSLYGSHFNIGYGSEAMDQYSKKDTMIAMEIWIKEIMQNSEDTIHFHYFDDSQKMADAIKLKKIDLVITYGLDFVKYFKKSDLDDAFTGGMSDRELEYLMLVTHKSSSKEKFLALRNPRIAVQVSEEISKLYAEYYFLKHKGKKNITFLNVIKRQEGLLKVFFKNADAALVTQKTLNFAKELNPQMGQNIIILEKTNIPAGSFGFFRKGIDLQSRRQLIDMALNVPSTNRGRQVLDIFQTGTVVETHLEELIPIEKFYNEYKILKNKKVNK